MITEINIHQEGVVWLPLAVQYFFFIGLAAASLLTAALSPLWSGSRTGVSGAKSGSELEVVAVLVAVAGVVVGPLCLLSELHQAGRFSNFYLHPAPTSWMSLGSVLIPFFAVTAFLYFLLLLRDKAREIPHSRLSRWLQKGKLQTASWLVVVRIIAGIAALSIFLYTGAEVYVVAARPLWHTLAFPIAMAFSALFGAAALIRFFLLFSEESAVFPAEKKALSILQSASLLFLLFAGVGWLTGDAPAVRQLHGLFQNSGHYRLLAVLFSFFSVFSLLLALFSLKKNTSFRSSFLLLAANTLCALGLMWFCRWVWLIDVQRLPRFNVTPNSYTLAAGHGGLLSIVTSFIMFAVIVVLGFCWLRLCRSSLAPSPSSNRTRGRRLWLAQSGFAITGLLALVTGFSSTGRQIAATLKRGTSGTPTRDRIHGNSLVPEGAVTSGNEWQDNPGQFTAFTQCYGCWTQCGLRVRVDRETGTVLRVDGNPYNPLSQERHYPYTLPIAEAFTRLAGEEGLNGRSTACARGAALHLGIDPARRVLSPLKRVGPRGSGKWQRISFTQLISEVVGGGDLFGEGQVDGLKDIYGPDILLDPEHPSFGSRSNQLLATMAGAEGRQQLMKRFSRQAFGSVNYSQHGSYCGLNYRSGSGALFDDLKTNKHAKPDWEHLQFGLFWGTSPAQAGNPFKRQGRQLASARKREDFRYVVIDPALPNSLSRACDKGRWLPIQPGSDGAMAMAMIQYILAHKLYAARYLACPTAEAALSRGEKSHSNATHLVVTRKDHPHFGKFVRMGWLNEKSSAPDMEVVLVAGQVTAANQAAEADLFGQVELEFADGAKITARTALGCLQEAANQLSLEQYSEQCGIAADEIAALSREFTSYGPRAAVITHGGMMHGSGFYSAWAIMMLNALIGNLNHKGGLSISGGKFPEFSKGPRYNLSSFPGSVKPGGLNLARGKKAYEGSDEYARKVARGESPYPARAPWYPFAGGQLTEMIPSALQGYPYRLKAWINGLANPVYSIAGAEKAWVEMLKDPQNLPLFISIDTCINETSALADYIVPDSHNFESWGFTAPWAGVPVKSSTARWPVVASPVEKTPEGEPVSLDTFLIAVAKEMGLPGFGKNAIPDMQGGLHNLDRPAEYYLRAAANIAYAGEPVPAADKKEMALSGVDTIWPLITDILPAEEQAKVAFVYSRGGRFAPYASGWKGDSTGPQWQRPMQIWNEEVGASRHAMSGRQFSGCPVWHPPFMADGSEMRHHYPKKKWPLLIISQKSNLISSSTIMLDPLREIRSQNIVAISPGDAAGLNITHGDIVKIKTPGNAVECQIAVLAGVAPGVIVVEHGWGHTGFGVKPQIIDGVPMPCAPGTGHGINLNMLGLVDPTRQEISGSWLDWVTGASIRQGIPAVIEK